MTHRTAQHIDETTDRLVTGHIVDSIRDDSAYVGHPFKTGFIAGQLYRSFDNGESWEASDLGFRS